MTKEIENIWSAICAHEGKTFRQIRGKEFSYEVAGNNLHLSTTNQVLSKSEIEKALPYLPLENTTPVQHLRAPSYIYAILMDTRISLMK